MKCDLVHNLCGWFVQFTDNGSNVVRRTHLLVITELQAMSAAHDLGFDEMTVWEYEHQTKTIVIPKGHNGSGNRSGNNGAVPNINGSVTRHRDANGARHNQTFTRAFCRAPRQ